MEVILERLHRLREAKGNPPFELIAEKGKVPVGTVKNLFYGKSHFPNVDTMYKIVVVALGGSLDKLFADADVSIGDVQPLKEEVESLASENKKLKEQNITILTQNVMLRMQLNHKEEIIRLHERYNK